MACVGPRRFGGGEYVMGFSVVSRSFILPSKKALCAVRRTHCSRPRPPHREHLAALRLSACLSVMTSHV